MDDAALLCTTDKNPLGRTGEWLYPNGTMVPIMGTGWSYYRNRGPSLIRLHRRPLQGLSVMNTGMYCCEIPDRNDMMKTLCVGAYLTESAGEYLLLFV